MSEYRGTAGCPICLVPWAVEDWETYLSVKCPQCGRPLGEVAVRADGGRGPFEILGQQLPMGVPEDRSAVVDGGPEEAARLAEAAEMAALHAYLAAAYPAAPERHSWRYWWPLILWFVLAGLILTISLTYAMSLPH